MFRYNMRCQPTKERDAMTDNILNLKTAVEGARGFYISRRGAETRRFMGVIRQLNALMLFTHKVKICKAVLFRSK